MSLFRPQIYTRRNIGVRVPLLILNLGKKMKMSSQLHAPAALTADETPMRVKQEVCGAPQPAWIFCGQKNSCPYGDSNPGSSIS